MNTGPGRKIRRPSDVESTDARVFECAFESRNRQLSTIFEYAFDPRSFEIVQRKRKARDERFHEILDLLERNLFDSPLESLLGLSPPASSPSGPAYSGKRGFESYARR
jgi:hypothetical protein